MSFTLLIMAGVSVNTKRADNIKRVKSIIKFNVVAVSEDDNGIHSSESKVEINCKKGLYSEDDSEWEKTVPSSGTETSWHILQVAMCK
jgi:hypothetical protein